MHHQSPLAAHIHCSHTQKEFAHKLPELQTHHRVHVLREQLANARGAEGPKAVCQKQGSLSGEVHVQGCDGGRCDGVHFWGPPAQAHGVWDMSVTVQSRGGGWVDVALPARFYDRCMQSWLMTSRTCPLCRLPLDSDS